MTDGIGKGVGQQISGIGSQLGDELSSLPKSLFGLDSGTNEKKSPTASGGKVKTGLPKAQSATPQADPLAQLQQKDELEKQRKLAQIRQELKGQFVRPTETPKNAAEQAEIEKIEQQKKEIAEERKKLQPLNAPQGKQKRGLFGRIKKQQQFGSEQGKNVVSQ